MTTPFSPKASQVPQPTLKRTSLYEAHVRAGARLVPFAGWEMPLHYGSQLEEHLYTRRAVSVFDVSHMGQIEVTDAYAMPLVQEIVTRNIEPLKVGEVVYAALCREDGGLMDDLLVSRLGAQRYLLVVNAATYEQDVALMDAIARRLALPTARLVPCAEQWAMIALQGPLWAEVMHAVLGQGRWQVLPPMRTVELTYAGKPLIVSTTGYTGEPGVELLCPPENALALWDGLIKAGALPAGLAARDTLRLEKGFVLSGQDFTVENNPYEAGLGWVVALGKTSFSGREALARIHAAGLPRRLVGLRPEGRRIPRHGATVLAGERPVGVVTSGGFAPSLGHPVALAYVETEFAALGRELKIELGQGVLQKAVVAPRVFYPVP